MKKYPLGTIELGQTLNVSDPCYKEGEGEQINLDNFRKGTYLVSVVIADNMETDGMGNRAASLWVEPFVNVVISHTAYKNIGHIGVDSAMVGIFPKKPDFEKEELWKMSSELIAQENLSMLIKNGVVSKSGFGDGVYPVLAVKNRRGEYIALAVTFI